MAKLGEVCTIVSGSTPKTSVTSYWDGNIKWITPAELNEDTFYIMDSVRHITEEGKEKNGLSYLPTGTVILSSRAPIGKTAIAGCKMCCNQGFKNLICSDAVYNEYLYFFLKSKTDYLNSLGRGATFKEISKSIVESIEIPLPEVNQQKEIAEKFKKLEQLISLRKQQLAKLDELVKARFVEMFGKASLLAQNQTKRLEECCISISGGNTPSMQHPEYYGGNIPFVKSGDVKGDYIVESTLTLTKTALTETTAKILPKSTLIVVIRSAALLKEFRIGMLMVDAVINQDLKALQVSEDFLPVYLMWAIKMQHQVLLNKVQTMLTSHIRMEDLLNLKIGTPPLSLQNQFAAFVERVDQQKQTVQQSLEKLELMKKALMQEYFG